MAIGSKKLIFRSGSKSRYIDYPFNIVGGFQELRDLYEQIKEQIEGRGFSYGTVYINERLIQGTSNTEPSEWEE